MTFVCIFQITMSNITTPPECFLSRILTGEGSNPRRLFYLTLYLIVALLCIVCVNVTIYIVMQRDIKILCSFYETVVCLDTFYGTNRAVYFSYDIMWIVTGSCWTSLVIILFLVTYHRDKTTTRNTPDAAKYHHYVAVGVILGLLVTFLLMRLAYTGSQVGRKIENEDFTDEHFKNDLRARLYGSLTPNYENDLQSQVWWNSVQNELCCCGIDSVENWSRVYINDEDFTPVSCRLNSTYDKCARSADSVSSTVVTDTVMTEENTMTNLANLKNIPCLPLIYDEVNKHLSETTHHLYKLNLYMVYAISMVIIVTSIDMFIRYICSDIQRELNYQIAVSRGSIDEGLDHDDQLSVTDSVESLDSGFLDISIQPENNDYDPV